MPSNSGSPFLSLPGAVNSSGADAGVASHYANPFTEQRDLSAGVAVVDLSHRAVLSVSGPDRLSWIDSITSQAVKSLAPGESSETLVLDQAGRLQYAVKLLDDGHTLWLLLEASEAPGLLTWLTSMRFMLRVELADRTADYATVGSFGVLTTEITASAAAPNGVPLVWRDPWDHVSAGGHQYAADAEHPALEWNFSETLVDRVSIAAVAAKYPVAGLLALEALRIAAWRPRRATEVDEKSIPHELDWLRSAVHLNKGCYRGQETVAKVHNLGHPPRRLVMLHLDGSDAVLPAVGDPVLLPAAGAGASAAPRAASGLSAEPEVTVGRITSAAMHYELGPIALAIIKRSTAPLTILAVKSGETLVSAAQQIIVPTDAGAVANVPRLPRLGAVPR